MSKATPGPWFLHVSDSIQVSDKQFHTNKSAIVHWMGFDSSDKPRDVKIANARLIASAPDLLAACKNAREVFIKNSSEIGEWDYIIQSLTEAVAKAEAAP